MAVSASEVFVRRIRRGEWRLYRALRLASLNDSPEAFSAKYEDAIARSNESWQQQTESATSGTARATLIAFVAHDVPSPHATHASGDSHESASPLASDFERTLHEASPAMRAVGIVSLYQNEEARTTELMQMWVDPLYRGGTVASTLMSEALTWARTAGFERVVLEVFAMNTRAIAYYRRQGFVTEGKAAQPGAIRMSTHRSH